MTDTEWKAVKRLILQNAKLFNEWQILQTVLFKYLTEGRIPKSYPEVARELRELPLHRGRLLRVEAMLSKADQDSGARDLERILSDLTSDRHTPT